jgi:hypothetical protein
MPYPYADGEAVHHMIANSAQLGWLRDRWPYTRYSHWRVGCSQTVDGRFMNLMIEELGPLFYARSPLVKWWEVEVADLPLDIPASM